MELRPILPAPDFTMTVQMQTCSRRSAVHSALLFVCMFATMTRGNAETNALGLQVGSHYYAISNLSDPAIPVLRGKAGAQGYAHDAIILAPDTRYREWILQIRTMQAASEDFTTPSVGQRFQMPRFLLQPVSSSDSDGDGLHDLAEFILGTNSNKADTDGDGVQDGAEVLDGTDPLDGLPASIGIIAATDTPGTAVDVCAINDIAIVANREAGVSVLNVAGQNAIRIAEVDTPGTALRVACSGNLIAVADGPAGLAIIDITDPPASRITNQINLGSPARAITAAGTIAFIGLNSGEIVAVDLQSGLVLSRRQLGAAVQDMAVSGDQLLAATSSALLVLNPYELDLPTIGSIPMSGALRLVAGNGVAYVTVSQGFDTFTFANPSQPVRLRQNRPGQTDWRHIAFNGSGLGIAAVNQGFFGTPLDVELYNLPAADQPPQFTTRITTPGEAQAVSIYNGRAYVADGVSGLQVINYLAYDSGTNLPAITLSASFGTNNLAEEGKLVRVTATVTDDVQVRNVEFYVDGIREVTDGNFPFEHRFITPVLTATRTNFTLRAKATDTGGNFAWSDTITVALVPDATPPRVTRVYPDPQSVLTTNTTTVLAYFNEPIDTTTLGGGAFYLLSAGPDTRLDSSDDFVIGGGSISYRDTLNAAVLSFTAPFPLGIYRVSVTTAVADLAGNHPTNNFQWRFAILSGGPNDDDDSDGLTNAQELQLGSNPFVSDSDGDGWSDLDEFENGTNPTDGNVRPQQIFLAYPPLQIDLPSPEANGTSGVGVIVARPPLQIDLPSPDAFGNAGVGIILALPPVQIDLPSPEANGTSGVGLVLARPPLSIDLPSPDTAGTNGLGLFLAKPPVSIKIPTQ